MDKFVVTPEQIKGFTNKRPYLAIEKYLSDKNYFIAYCFIEVKSIINSHFSNIIDQLHDTLFVGIDDYGDITGNYSVYMIAMKETKIPFYTYHYFTSLLDECDILNYKGFTPFNYQIPKAQYLDINSKFPLVHESYELYKKKA